jgi:hypothetical protein
MNETCDRCGPTVRAMYRADRTGELYLCRHCASRLWQALSAQGWTIWPASEQALGPHASRQSLPNLPRPPARSPVIADEKRRLAAQENSAIIASRVDSETRRGRDYVRVVISNSGHLFVTIQRHVVAR